MDDTRSRPAAHRACSVAQSPPHQMLLCKVCRHHDASCGPGLALLQKLRAAVALAGVEDGFEISGTVRLAGCDRPCTAAWRATGKATWFFGDVDPDQPIDELIAFSQKTAMADARGNAADRQPAPALARIPAAMIATREGVIQ